MKLNTKLFLVYLVSAANGFLVHVAIMALGWGIEVKNWGLLLLVYVLGSLFPFLTQKVLMEIFPHITKENQENKE